MNYARRHGLLDAKPGANTHAGLLLDRYLCAHKEMLDEREKGDQTPEEKLLSAIAGVTASEVYKKAYDRWFNTVKERRYLNLTAKTAGALAVGLGNKSPLEAGLAIHHTYGMPYIPGSAIKGLCRRAAATQKLDADQIKALFGDTSSAAQLTFHDAWFNPLSENGSPFHRDVLTVHHPGYYQQKEGAWPTDFDDPIPVPFLVVRPDAQFLFAVECPHAQWREFVLQMLQHGIRELGVGGKTNAGYGRFDDIILPPPEPVDEVWHGVTVTRQKSPLKFTFAYSGNKYELQSNQANKINEGFTPDFREKLKKHPTFEADVKVKIEGEKVTVQEIIPAEGK